MVLGLITRSSPESTSITTIKVELKLVVLKFLRFYEFFAKMRVFEIEGLKSESVGSDM